MTRFKKFLVALALMVVLILPTASSQLVPVEPPPDGDLGCIEMVYAFSIPVFNFWSGWVFIDIYYPVYVEC